MFIDSWMVEKLGEISGCNPDITVRYRDRHDFPKADTDLIKDGP